MLDIPNNEARSVRFDEFSTPKHLAHATEQAIKRNYQDFLIVDVDSHHYENENYPEVFEYIESPVMRREALNGGGVANGFLNTQVGAQNLSGRITRHKGRKIEKPRLSKHRDIGMTLDWMDAMGVDYACLFPTPMLFLSVHPIPEVEAAMSQAYNRWLCERILAEEHRIYPLALQRLARGELRVVGRRVIGGLP
ncbi:MAG TPA: hypothetical protein PKB01_09650 [Xanthobacteraceae bacterium]|nr:hypothetical protein [Xanthobacteraceae bacterium]